MARLPLCSHGGKVLNLWSLHLKMFLTFPSPLLSSHDWFPTLHRFTAYVTNDEHVLFLCSDPCRRQNVNDVVFRHICLSVLYIASGPPSFLFFFITSNLGHMHLHSPLPFSHPEPRLFLPDCCQEHLGSLSLILPIALWGAPDSTAPSSLLCVCRGTDAVCSCWDSFSGFKYSNGFHWYAAVMTHFYGFSTSFCE